MASTIESLLVLKQWLEDEAKNVFAQTLKALSIEEDILKTLEERLNSLKEEFIAISSSDTNINTIKGICDYQDYLISKIKSQKALILEKEVEVEEARKKLVEATKERKIFEKLREKEVLEKKREQDRIERMQADDSTSARFTRQEI